MTVPLTNLKIRQVHWFVLVYLVKIKFIEDVPLISVQPLENRHKVVAHMSGNKRIDAATRSASYELTN